MSTAEKILPNNQISDFKKIVDIHRDEINEGFLAKMNDKFLITLYRTISRLEDSFLLATRKDGEITGFLAGSINTSKVYKNLLFKSWISLFFSALPELFSFKRIIGIFETLFYPSKTKEPEIPDAEIINFCVSSKMQRQGIGKILFSAMLDEYRQLGIDKIKIVTGSNQDKAQSFYERLGAQLVKKISIHKGVTSLVYTYDIPPAEKELNRSHT